MGITPVQVGPSIAGCVVVSIICVLVLLHMFSRLNCPSFIRGRPRHQKNTQDIELQAQHRFSTLCVDGELEKYGELYIPPNRNPLHVGLDIVNRVLLATGLRMHTVNQDAVSAMEQGRALRLSLRLPRPMSITPSEDASQAFSANQVTALSQFAADSHCSALVAAVSRVQRDRLSSSPDRRETATKESAGGIQAGQWVAVAREELAIGRMLGEVEFPEERRRIEQAQRQQEVSTVGDDETDGDEAEAAVPSTQAHFGTGRGMAQLYIEPNVARL